MRYGQPSIDTTLEKMRAEGVRKLLVLPLYPQYSATTTGSVFDAVADTLSNGEYTDTVQFTNTTNHDGDTTRAVQLTVGVPVVQYEWNLDGDPGWTCEGEWAFGGPTGGGSSTPRGHWT